MTDDPAATTTEAAEPYRPTRISDTVALGLLAGWLIFRQITARIGIAFTARKALRIARPWVIPLLTNAPPQLIIAGTGASGHWGKIIATIATSVLMSTITGLIFYWAGYRFGHKLAEMSKKPGSPWAGIWNPKQIARAERWMDRWGIAIVFLGRASEHFTLPITLVAGASEMRMRRFLAAHIAGAIAYAGLFLWVGSVAHERFPWLEHWLSTTYVKWAFWVGIAALGLLVIAWLLSRFIEEKPKEGESATAGELPDPEDQVRETTTPSQGSSVNPPENDDPSRSRPVDS